MQTERMFDAMARKYDRLNRVLSLGLDRGWRRATIRALGDIRGKSVLDVATGSGDLALAALAAGAARVTAIDVSAAMLDAAAAKAGRCGCPQRVVLARAAAEALPFADDSFDAVCAGFGARNFADLEKGLAEMRRVLKPGGRVVVLEFSRPRALPLRPPHRFYLKRVIPLIGGALTGRRSAYAYLGESILAFPDGADFMNVLSRAGFSRVTCRRLTLGVCSIYTAEKRTGTSSEWP